jgi:hypothetical protein
MFAMDDPATDGRAFHPLGKAQDNDDEPHTERDGEPDQCEWQILMRRWRSSSEKGQEGPQHSSYSLRRLRSPLPRAYLSVGTSAKGGGLQT